MAVGILISIIWFICILSIFIQTNFDMIGTGKIKHNKEWVYRALCLIPAFGCLLFPLDNLTVWYILAKSVIIAFLLGSFWWEFFDGLLNIKRKKSWRYNGSDDPDDAKLDDFLQKYTPRQQMFIKWGLIIISTTLYTLSIIIFN